MYKIDIKILNLLHGGIPRPRVFFLEENDPVFLNSDIQLNYLGDGIISINNQSIDLKKEPDQSYYFTTPFFLKTQHHIEWKISYDGKSVIVGNGPFASRS